MSNVFDHDKMLFLPDCFINNIAFIVLDESPEFCSVPRE